MADIYEKYKKHLTKAQVKALVEMEKKYRNLYAQQRAAAYGQLVDQTDSTQRALQNMGLAGRQGKYISGVHKVGNERMTRPYEDYNAVLDRAANAQLERQAVRMANQTIAARAKADYERRIAEQQKQMLAQQQAANQQYNNALWDRMHPNSPLARQNYMRTEPVPMLTEDQQKRIQYATDNARQIRNNAVYDANARNENLLRNPQMKQEYTDVAVDRLSRLKKEYEPKIKEWQAKIDRAKDISTPKTRNELEIKQDAERARQEMSRAQSDVARANAAALLPRNVSDLVLLSDKDFDMRFSAAKDSYKKLQNEVNRYKLASGTNSDNAVPQALRKKLSDAAAMLSNFERAKGARDETSEQGYYWKNFAVDENTSAKYKGDDTTKSVTVDYDKKHGTGDSKWAAVINQYAKEYERASGSSYLDDYRFWADTAEKRSGLFTGGGNMYDAMYRQPYARSKGVDSVKGQQEFNVSMYLASLMTDEEVERFNTIYDKYGAKKADEYFEYLRQNDLLSRGVQSIMDMYNTEVGDANGWKKAGVSALSIQQNVWSGVASLFSPLFKTDDLATEKINAIAFDQAAVAREAISQNMGWWGSMGYNTLMSMGDSLYSMALAYAAGGGGAPAALTQAAEWFGSVALGGSAFNSAYREALDRGLSTDKAMLTAVGSGINEMLFEKISVGTLLEKTGKGEIKAAKNAFVNWAVNTLVQGGVEGSEEVFTDLANKLWDDYLNGYMSEAETKMRELIQQGYTFEQAKKIVGTEYAEQLGASFLGGMLSGVSMAGVGQGVNALQNRGSEKLGKGLRQNQNLMDKLTGFDFKSETAQEILQQNKLTNMDVAELYSIMQQELLERYNGDIQKAVADGKITQEDANLIHQYEQNGVQITKDGKVVKNENGVTAEQYVEVQNAISQMDSAARIQLLDNEQMRQLIDAVGGDVAAAIDTRSTAEAEANRKYRETLAGINADETLSDDLKQKRREAAERTKANEVSEARKEFDKSLTSKKLGKLEIDENGNIKTAKGSGTVSFDFSTEGHNTIDSMTADEQSALRIAQIAAASGSNVKVESEFVGEHANENGYYDRKTNTIHINMKGRNSVLWTLSHELTHYLAAQKTEAYNQLRDAIRDELQSSKLLTSDLMQKGFDYDLDNVDKYIEKTGNLYDALVAYERDERGYGKDAEEEVIARCCESFLADNVFVKAFASKHYKSAKTIAQFLARFSEDASRVVENAGERAYSEGFRFDESPERQILSQVTNIQKIAQIWEKAVNMETKKRNAAKEETRASKMDVVKQDITSADTSISQIPALFTNKNVEFGKTNIDIGGGRFDLATNYLAERGTKNMVFDPYNRDEAVNSKVVKFLQDGNKADTATCANVLNVIAEKEARANVILEVAKSIKKDGKAYFMVYEGDGTGIGKRTSKGYQNNRKTADYVDEIKQYFDPNSVTRKGKLIIAENPLPNLPKAMWEVTPGKGVRFSKSDNVKLSDTEYLDLAEKYKNGTATEAETEALQKAVDAAAKANGYVPVARFHQTKEAFNRFSTDNPVAGLHDSETPNGIFLKTNDHDIGIGGSIQMPLYLASGNYLHFLNRKEANAWYCKNVQGYESLQNEMESKLKEFEDRIAELEKQEFDPSKTDEEVDKLFEEEQRIIDEMRPVENEYRMRLRELLNQYFLNGKHNYDGIELDYDGHRWVNGKRENVHTYIAFKANQLKSADLVTYDKDDNIIPLSERFKTDRTGEGAWKNEDIRFSKSDNVKLSDSEYMNLAEKYKNGTATETETDALRKAVDAAAKRAGYTIKGMHGTTKLFWIFDRAFANVEGDWGKGFYFTTNSDDVKTNYASSSGADLETKIDRLAEELAWQDDMADLSEEELHEKAREMLDGGEKRVIDAYLRVTNPVNIGGDNETYFDYEDGYNAETDEYDGEEGGSLIEFIQAVQDELEENYEWENVNRYDFSKLYDYAYDGGVSASELEKITKEILMDVFDDEGHLATNEIIRAAFERMGFDAIIDSTVARKFGSRSGRRNGGMVGVDEDTKHIIVFDSSQAKQSDPVTYDDKGNIIPLEKRFNTENEDIRYSKKDSIKLTSGGETRTFELGNTTAKMTGSAVDLEGGTVRNKVDMMQSLAERYDKVYTDAQSEAEARAYQNAGAHRMAEEGGEFGTWEFTYKPSELKTDSQYDQKQKDEFARDVLHVVGTRKNFTYAQMGKYREALGRALTYLHSATFGKGDQMAAFDAVDRLFDRIINGYAELSEADEQMRDTILSQMRSVKDANGRTYKVLEVTDKQAAEIKNAYDNMRTFTAKLSRALGTRVAIKTVQNATMLENMFTHTDDSRFDSSIVEGDMPNELLRLAEQTKEHETHSYRAESEERAAVKESMWDKALEIVGAEKSATQKVREAVKETRAAERKAAKEKTAKAVDNARLAERMHEGALRAKDRRIAENREAELKRRAAERETRLKQQFKETTQKASEARLKRDIRKTALKWNQRLVKMLANPTEASHVPVQLAREVAALTQTITEELDSTTERGRINLAKVAKAYEQAFKAQDTIKEAQKENPEYDPRGSILDIKMKDNGLVEMMDELNTLLAEKSFDELSAYEMMEFLNVVRGVANTVYNANRMIGQNEHRMIWEVGDKLVNELETAPSVTPDSKLGRALRGYFETSLDLRRMALMFSGSNENAEFVKLVNQLNDGAIEKARVARDLKAVFDPVTNKYGDEIRTWYGKKAEWIDTGLRQNGKKVEITKGMRVALALHVLNEGNMKHIENGGLTIPDRALYNEGKLSEAYAKKSGRQIVQMTADQINEIISHMTEAEKAYVEAAKEFFHNRTGYYVNRTSLQLLGYAKAIVDNYFPIHTNKNFTYEDWAQSMMQNASVEHQGFLKERADASNPIFLEDITSVVNRQIQGVSLYAGLAVPMRNFNAVRNSQVWHENEGRWERRTSVKETMIDKLGKYGYNIIDSVLKDLSEMPNVDVTPMEKFAGRLATNYVKAVLLGNLKVSLKQIASYPTAAAVIPWKYLNKALVAGGRNHRMISRADADLINQYTPLYQMRQEGYANEITSIMQKRGIEEKMPGLLGWITKMDVATVGRLWSAAEYMVADQTNLPVGSDAFYKEVAEVFNRTIQQTQPNFTPLQRNAALRSKNPLVRSLVLFGTQRMQNSGILIEAAMQLKNAKTKAEIQAARQKLGRAVASQIVQNILLLVASIGVDMLRGRMKSWQDEDKEITAESVANGMGDMFLSNFVGSFLGGSELYSAISGLYKVATGKTAYDTEFTVPALDAIETLVNFVQSDLPNSIKYLSGDHTDEEKKKKLISFSMQLAKVAGYATGLPFENAIKDVFKGIIPAIQDVMDWKNTGELNPWLHQSGKLDKKKTNANYKEWTKNGYKGSEYFYWEKKLSDYSKRDDRAAVLMESDLPNEKKAMLLSMMDTSGATYNGTSVYRSNGDLYMDFANPTEKQKAMAVPSQAEVDLEAMATPEPTPTPNPLSDSKMEGVQEAVAKGVDEQTAVDAFLTYQNIGAKEGRDDEFREWMFKNVKKPEDRATLELQVIGRAAKAEGAVTYRESGTVYRDYTNEAWYKLSQHSLAKDGTNKRYDAGKKLVKTGLPVEKTVAIYEGLKDLTKKAEWKDYLKKQGLTDEQINIFLWSRGWAK